MARTFLALGSNLGDRIEFLRCAVKFLPGSVRCSRVYETDPVDATQGSGPFLNAVVELDFEPEPSQLLSLVTRLERRANRVRSELNGPRTLDVDVVFVEGMVSRDGGMTVPHPRCNERAFVIAPLYDLDPGLAQTLNPEMCRLIGDAIDRDDAEVYPGVVVWGETIC